MWWCYNRNLCYSSGSVRLMWWRWNEFQNQQNKQRKHEQVLQFYCLPEYKIQLANLAQVLSKEKIADGCTFSLYTFKYVKKTGKLANFLKGDEFKVWEAVVHKSPKKDNFFFLEQNFPFSMRMFPGSCWLCIFVTEKEMNPGIFRGQWNPCEC